MTPEGTELLCKEKKKKARVFKANKMATELDEDTVVATVNIEYEDNELELDDIDWNDCSGLVENELQLTFIQ